MRGGLVQKVYTLYSWREGGDLGWTKGDDVESSGGHWEKLFLSGLCCHNNFKGCEGAHSGPATSRGITGWLN